MENEINILALYQNILGTKLSYLSALTKSYWAHTGKFSLTNLHRWIFGPSTGLRSIERFFATPHDWGLSSAELISSFLYRLSKSFSGLLGYWVVAVDETVGKKAGHATHGIGLHYSSKDSKVIKSVAVLNLSLLHVGTKLSLPICQEQLLFNTSEHQGKSKKKLNKVTTLSSVETLRETPKKAGRPKGSKNKIKEEVEIAYTFKVLEQILSSFFLLFVQYLSKIIQIRYLVGDGGFGNNTVAKIAQNQNLHLISKLQYNAALYFPFAGEYSGLGRPKEYGNKIDYKNLPQDALVKNQTIDGVTYLIYHFKKMIHKSFDMPLNVVVLVKINGDKKSRPTILFSTDLNANDQTIIEHYHARFQIEFNFRDAREFFGLSHFKNIKQNQVKNTIGFAFFMVTISNIIRFEIKVKHPNCQLSIQDLKAFFRAEKYLNELLNNPENKSGLFLSQYSDIKIPIIGAINFN
jgi:putative transposase